MSKFLFFTFCLLAPSCLLIEADFLNPHFVLTKLDSQDADVPHYRAPRSIRKQRKEATIEKFHVYSQVTSRYSKVTVTSDVRNDGETAREVGVTLRLPKKAFISNFSMVIDSVTYVGIVKEKKAAKAQYEEAVSRGESAGLVSSKSHEVQSFAVSVNVAAGDTVTFELNYDELLMRKLGTYNHVIYVDPGQLVSDMKIEVEISEPIGIETITAAAPTPIKRKRRKRQEVNLFDTQENVIIRRSFTQAYILYTPSLSQQQRLVSDDLSFVVKYDVKRETLGGEILIKDGYFVHFFAPQNLPVIPKNIVFVIDRSGSMYGSKISQTKKALRTILDDLHSQDKFNIITFSSDSRVWQRNEMMEASRHNIRRAKKFVRGIAANGGTNFYGATTDAISLLDTISGRTGSSLEQAYMMILLTDGQPTVGVTDTQRIRSSVNERVNGKYSVFCLEFGEDVDHAFLKNLANENKGLSRQIYTDSDAVLQLKGFYDEVASPLLAHVILKYNGLPVVETTKLTFDNYFDGSEIVVTGRIEGEPRESELLELQGLIEARSSNGDTMIVAKGEEMEDTFSEGFDMEKLWAYLTIKELIKNKTLLFENQTAVNSIDQEILRLSLKFNFVTPLTSMVVTKPGKDTIARDKDSSTPFLRPNAPLYDSQQPRIMSSRLLAGPKAGIGMMGTYANFPRTSAHRQRRPKKTRRRKLFKQQFFGRRLRGHSYRRTTTAATTTTTTPRATETTTPYVSPVPRNPLMLETSCFEELILNTSVNITSPRFPGLYPSNTQCVWNISLSDDVASNGRQNITVTFQHFDLEKGSCSRDRVLMYPNFGKSKSEKPEVLCGSSGVGNAFHASNNMVLVFQSDEIVNGRGFAAILDVL